MAIRIIVSQTPAPPGPEWISIFDDTYWKATQGYWDSGNSRWVENNGGEGMYMQPANGATWHVGFRPTKMRITGTVLGEDLLDLRFGWSSSDLIGRLSPPFGPSPWEIDLDWSDGQDLFVMIPSVLSYITNIEFYSTTDPR